MPLLRSMPTWHESYEAAIFESDRRLTIGRINQARKALKERLTQLDLHQNDEQRWEAERILNALRMLELLQRTTSSEAA